MHSANYPGQSGSSGRWPRPERRRVVGLPVQAETLALLPGTLEALARNTSPETELVILALGIESTVLQHRVRELPALATARIITTRYLEVWPALLRGLPAEYDQDDLLLVQPGLEVPYGWDARLALAAYCQESRIAAVSPLCNSVSLFSPLTQNPEPTTLETVDSLALTLGSRRNFALPGLFSGCCYLRRAALLAINAELDTAAQRWGWSEAAFWLVRLFQRYGWHVVGCDHVYVQDHDPHHRQQTLRSVEQSVEARQIAPIHPLTGLRFALNDVFRRGAATQYVQAPRRPVQLHIAHSWGGGLDRWIQQYCAADQERNNLVLRSIGNWGAFGQQIALYRSAAMDQPLRRWALDYPIRATATTHLQYRTIVEAVITEFNVEAVLVSSLIGHALDALTTDLPTVVIAHDYYPFCPALVIYFNEICTTCTLPQLAHCFSDNEHNRFFNNITAEEWLDIRQRFGELILRDSIVMVAPSESVSGHWRRLLPSIANKPFRIIPHGMNFAPPRIPAPPVADKLRIVILGSLAPQKGRRLLEQLWPLIAAETELALVGCGEEGESFRNHPGVTLISQYQHDALASIIASLKPEVGLLLSIVPETFSYTLSELWLLGIPVVATNLGSFADRIEDGVNGYLCPPQAEAIAEKLRWLALHRTALEPLRSWLAGFQHRRIEQMVADYHAMTPLPVFTAPRYFAATVLDHAVEAAPVKALYVNPQASFIQVLEDFSHYAHQKLSATPRLRAWQKRGNSYPVNSQLASSQGASDMARYPS